MKYSIYGFCIFDKTNNAIYNEDGYFTHNPNGRGIIDAKVFNSKELALYEIELEDLNRDEEIGELQIIEVKIEFNTLSFEEVTK